MTEYDNHYKKKEYFGKPYDGLVDFFASRNTRRTVCDLGAGQGRDSCMLSALGYNVTAVDISIVGLEQLKEKCPKVKIVVADIYTYDVSKFDIILLDSMVHFYKPDLEKEKGLIVFIIRQMKKGALLVNCMLKSKKAERVLHEILDEQKEIAEVILEKYVSYPEFSSEYIMTVVEKG